jgi:hypothetical protein
LKLHDRNVRLGDSRLSFADFSFTHCDSFLLVSNININNNNNNDPRTSSSNALLGEQKLSPRRAAGVALALSPSSGIVQFMRKDIAFVVQVY